MEQKTSESHSQHLHSPLFEEDEGVCGEEGEMANLLNTFDAPTAARDQRRANGERKGQKRRRRVFLRWRSRGAITSMAKTSLCSAVEVCQSCI